MPCLYGRKRGRRAERTSLLQNCLQETITFSHAQNRPSLPQPSSLIPRTLNMNPDPSPEVVVGRVHAAAWDHWVQGVSGSSAGVGAA
eukprot:1295339-Rhodomonas_salina.1